MVGGSGVVVIGVVIVFVVVPDSYWGCQVVIVIVVVPDSYRGCGLGFEPYKFSISSTDKPVSFAIASFDAP